jgi:alpha-D-xyloside xylohydrolase
MVYTHALEQKEVLRALVVEAAVEDTLVDGLTLRTRGVMTSKRLITSADPEMFALQRQVGESVEGRLRIDVVSDRTLRVRYSEGRSVPENETPMLVDFALSPSKCEITEDDDRVTIKTAEIEARISLNPYRVEVFDLSGQMICGVGGPEKNNFCSWDSYSTGICRETANGRPIGVENFDLAPGEAIYGLGESFMGLNKVGRTIDLDIVDGLGVITPRCYKNTPFFVSTRGYGVFFHHSAPLTYWVGSMSAADIQVAVEDDFLDYFIITGSIKEVLAGYTELTGKGVVPPDWTFGFWQSKISYTSAEETLDVVRKMRENEIPCDVIHLDTFWFKEDWRCDLEFDPDRFPDPKAYLDELASMGVKVSLWQLPYIPDGSPLFEDLAAVDGFVKNSDGGLYEGAICLTPGFTGQVGIVDYTNPRAVRVHQDYFRRLFRLGAKVIKTDFGESAPADGVYFDGTPGHRMHNLYPLIYNKAISDVTREETGDGVVWARSAWAGSQRYPLHWGGDNSPNFHNLVPQLTGGLSFGLSGFQFWSQDIGGFLGDTNDTLLVRWMQMGMFLSHSRIHGSGDREIYKFAPETIRICRDYLNLRYRLLPYILGSAQKCIAESLPMARALVVEYQDDPTVYSLADEYLFGESILVAPIYTEDGRRRVYLPKGVWTDWWTRERINGGQWIEVEAGIETIPLYIREGGVIPMGPVMQYVGEKPIDWITLLVAPFERDGEMTFDIPANGETLSVAYRAKGGIHSLTLPKSSVEFDVQCLGDVQLQVSTE